MTPVPEMAVLDVMLGNIKHMPKWDALPEDFRRRWHHRDFKPCEFVSQWFYSGLKDEAVPPVREGVDRKKALTALRAILCSFEPKHEHKIAGAGFLANEWFDFDAKPKGK